MAHSQCILHKIHFMKFHIKFFKKKKQNITNSSILYRKDPHTLSCVKTAGLISSFFFLDFLRIQNCLLCSAKISYIYFHIAKYPTHVFWLLITVFYTIFHYFLFFYFCQGKFLLFPIELLHFTCPAATAAAQKLMSHFSAFKSGFWQFALTCWFVMMFFFFCWYVDVLAFRAYSNFMLNS